MKVTNFSPGFCHKQLNTNFLEPLDSIELGVDDSDKEWSEEKKKKRELKMKRGGASWLIFGVVFKVYKIYMIPKWQAGNLSKRIFI